MDKPGSVPTLAGWYVISLRPSGGHASVSSAAAALGAKLLSIPTLRLVAVDAGAALDSALASATVVFTSPASVLFAQGQRALVAAPGQRWFAVGAGTAAQLGRFGITQVQSPDSSQDSEGLLALPGLQDLRDQDVGLVTAPGGRGLIAPTLAQRGARVRLAEVYRRVPLIPNASHLRRLADLPDHSALLVSSAEAFDGLWARLDETGRAQLRARPAVASSARLALRLADEGFAAIVLADGAAPSRLLAALAADVAGGRFR